MSSALTPYAAHSKTALNFNATRGEEETDQIYVFYSDEASVGIKTMRKYAPSPPALQILNSRSRTKNRNLPCFLRFISILEDKHIPRGIIIFKTSMTPSATKVLPLAYCWNQQHILIGLFDRSSPLWPAHSPSKPFRNRNFSSTSPDTP